MARHKIIFDGEEQDEVFSTYDEAAERADDMIAECREGGEILELSNPGDYPYDPDVEPDCEIVEEWPCCPWLSDGVGRCNRSDPVLIHTMPLHIPRRCPPFWAAALIFSGGQNGLYKPTKSPYNRPVQTKADGRAADAAAAGDLF